MGKRLLILSASTGSGHIKAAQAIEEASRTDTRLEAVSHLDSLEYTNEVFQTIYSKGYLEMVRNFPELWARGFEVLDKPWEKAVFLSAFHRFNSQPLVRKIRDFNPDMIICTHPMPADVIVYLINQDKLKANLGIVVTDYYIHALWLEEIFTHYFVAKNESKRYMCMLGLPPDRIHVTGIPVLEHFSSPVNLDEISERLQIPRDEPVIILSAGAFGLLSAHTIHKILKEIKVPSTKVVICGNNEKLKKELNEIIAKAPESVRARTKIVGFTDKMHEYLRLADIFIGKPGGLSTSECLAAAVPMVIWDPIPGQEQYNAYYVLESGAGVMPDSIATIGYKVDEILGNPDKLAQMKAAAKKAGFPNAAKSVLNHMLEKNNEAPVRPFKRNL